MPVTKKTEQAVFGGIEAGGNNFVCAIGTGPDDLREQIRVPTTSPGETIGPVIEFFRAKAREWPLAAIGIGTFGPVDSNPRSDTFGYVTSTPKPGWTNTDLRGPIAESLDLPVAFDTDVSAAAIGERRWGAASGLDNFVYLTVGTGIGGAAVSNGALVRGLVHPEMGHIRVPHDREIDPYHGSCPYHGDCLEGLASGPAIEKRWDERPDHLDPEHPAWTLEARYLALGVTNLVLAISPERLVIGGGVMKQRHLFRLVRQNVRELLNDYVQSPNILSEIDAFIVPPALGDLAGVLGAIAMASDAQRESG